MGAMKDMITDSNLKSTLCTLERANLVLRGQFKSLEIMENLRLLSVAAKTYLGLDVEGKDTQNVKNIFFSSFSTIELIEAVRNYRCKLLTICLEKMDREKLQ